MSPLAPRRSHSLPWGRSWSLSSTPGTAATAIGYDDTSPRNLSTNRSSTSTV